jgi:hypothetical protein
MESKSARRRASSASGVELIHIQGFAFSKSHMYQFSPLSGDLFYSVGSNIVVYDPVKNIQKDYLKNIKGLPFASLAFTKDGKELYAGEYMAKCANIKQYNLTGSGRFICKNSIKTSFRAIDALCVSFNKDLIAINGTQRNSDK